MANYRVNTGTNNNSNKTTQEKANKKYKKKTRENGSAKAFYTGTRVIKSIYIYIDRAHLQQIHI
jgi:hypothetical protein